MLVPFLAWAITGFVFFIKPGYAGAYDLLTPRTYPLEQSAVPLKSDPSWREVRYLRTILGNHLLVRTEDGWSQLDPLTYQPRKRPTNDEVKLLVKDAIALNPRRYGEVSAVSENKITTSSGVEITLNWDTLSLSQRGKDTDRIDLLYKIHYLQWTGIKSVDKVLGMLGIALVIVLTTLGLWLALKRG
jgi:hypothetical protein